MLKMSARIAAEIGVKRNKNILIVLGLIGILAGPVWAIRGKPSFPDLCTRAAHKAAQSTGVPVEVLMAISLTETGRKHEGRFGPWPWTLNIAGKGFWLDSRAAALERAQASLQAGQRSFDVGCFQVNYRWHGEAFASLSEMIEPEANARYAAEFLRSLYMESGDWTVAAGHYHSRTQVHADRYRKIFTRHLGRQLPGSLEPPVLAAVDSEPSQTRENLFPLLQSGAPASAMGSLVPNVTMSGGGLLSNHGGRALWSN
jgi:hypothetical protein